MLEWIKEKFAVYSSVMAISVMVFAILLVVFFVKPAKSEEAACSNTSITQFEEQSKNYPLREYRIEGTEFQTFKALVKERAGDELAGIVKVYFFEATDKSNVTFLAFVDASGCVVMFIPGDTTTVKELLTHIRDKV